MNWERTLERYPDVWTDHGTCPDPFDSLRKQNLDPAHKPHPPAVLEYHTRKSVPINGGDSGWVTCEVKVKIACPQTERHINFAGEVAFTKALELTMDGLSHMSGG